MTERGARAMPTAPEASGDGRRFVSRGGEKLAAALETLSIKVAGMRALDAGASTGGFTHCLLERGAREVVAIDVAYGQLAWTLRTDERVRVLERTNVRSITPGAVGEAVDLVVADLSFISLRAVSDALVGVTAARGRLLLLVKPQFELPRARVPRGGVVRDHDAWRDAIRMVADAYRARGCVLAATTPSRLVGPKGNREFFALLARSGADVGDPGVDAAVEAAP